MLLISLLKIVLLGQHPIPPFPILYIIILFASTTNQNSSSEIKKRKSKKEKNDQKFHFDKQPFDFINIYSDFNGLFFAIQQIPKI